MVLLRIYFCISERGLLKVDRSHCRRHRTCSVHRSASGATRRDPDDAHKSFSDLTPELYICRNFHGSQEVRETAGCPLKTSGVRRGISRKLTAERVSTSMEDILECAYSGKPLGGVGGSSSSSSGDRTMRANDIPNDLGGRTRVPHFLFSPFFFFAYLTA